MWVHRAADIKEEQQINGVATLRAQDKVEIALFCRRPDGVVEIELFGCTCARPFAKTAHGNLDVACAEFDRIIQIFVFALVPDLHRAAMAGFVLANAHALWIVAIGAERRGAPGPDPFIAAFMAFLLFFQTLFQRLHQFFPAAERFDFLLFLFGEEFFGHLAEPFFRQLLDINAFADAFEPFESMSEHLVEFIDIALVFDQCRAGEIIEFLDIHIDDALIHGVHQGQVFLECHRNLGGAKL